MNLLMMERTHMQLAPGFDRVALIAHARSALEMMHMEGAALAASGDHIRPRHNLAALALPSASRSDFGVLMPIERVHARFRIASIEQLRPAFGEADHGFARSASIASANL